MPKRAQVLTEDDQSRALVIIGGLSRYPERDAAMFALSHFAGLRVGEIAQLDLEDILDAEDRLREVVTLTRTKGGRKRELFLVAPALVAALNNHIAKISPVARNAVRAGTNRHPLFLTKNRKPFSSVTASQLFRRFYREWTSMPGASGHSGRRGFITQLANQGFNLKHIAVLAGHRSVSTTAIYVESNPHLLREMAASVVSSKVARALKA